MTSIVFIFVFLAMTCKPELFCMGSTKPFLRKTMRISGIIGVVCSSVLFIMDFTGVKDRAEQAETAVIVETTTIEESSTISKSAAASNVIAPLPDGIDLKNLQDCELSVEFTPADVTMKDGTTLVVNMKVYQEELFDAVEVSQMKVGDVLRVGGGDVEIHSIQETSGGYEINEGTDEGEYTMFPMDGGTYAAMTYDDQMTGHYVGEVTLPVDEDFEYFDRSDRSVPEQHGGAGDFLVYMSKREYGYTANGTKARVVDDKIKTFKIEYTP